MASSIILSLAVVSAFIGLVGIWVAGPDGPGARDLGLALFAAFASAWVLVVSVGVAPLLILGGIGAWWVERAAAWRLILAGVIILLPPHLLDWFG